MADIVLSNFGSYFGLFAGLNLGYATSQDFRDAINGRFFKLRKTERLLQSQIDSLRAKIGSMHYSTPKTHDRLNKLETDFNNGIHKISLNRNLASRFINGFKSMFLITTLFSLTVLIISGFFSAEEIDNNYCLYNALHFLNLTILGFDLLIFIVSFTKFSSFNLRPEITTLFFLIVIGAVIFFNKNYEREARQFSMIMSTKWCFALSVFVAVSPYLFHFLRAFIHKLFFYSYEFIFVVIKRFEFYRLSSYIKKIAEDYESEIS